MATEIRVANAGDKTYLNARAFGKGAPANGDKMVLDTITFPKGSQYTDTDNKKVYTRGAENKVAADFTLVGPAA